MLEARDPPRSFYGRTKGASGTGTLSKSNALAGRPLAAPPERYGTVSLILLFLLSYDWLMAESQNKKRWI